MSTNKTIAPATRHISSRAPQARKPTAERILQTAITSFATKGFEATSLDALGRSLGITKQTILHHYRTKEVLLEATISHVAAAIAVAVDGALMGREGETPWKRLERVVRAMFSLTSKNPELVGLVREVSRLRGPAMDRLILTLEPLTTRAAQFVRDAMVDPVPIYDPRQIVTSAYAAVVAAFVEVEVLQSLGQPPSARLLLRRRRELLGYLAQMMGVPR
jgi:TetR/AcrR family transcriptional regulator